MITKKQKMISQELHINKEWTLFLDRDGVINKKRENDYVKTWEEFEFLPGAIEGLKELSELFGKIIIVTNQRGIAKGLFTEQDFADISAAMLDSLEEQDVRIDWIFLCPHMGTEMICNCRKPKPGMALQAKQKFPSIRFDKSIMIGDSASDIEFGKFAGMTTVFHGEEKKYGADYSSKSLLDFAKLLMSYYAHD